MALITKISEILPYLPNGMSGEKLPNFQPAEERYLLPILGDALYAALNDAYEQSEDVPLSESMSRLMYRCRAVIVPFAFMLDLPFTQTTLTDNGLIALAADNQRKAFKWEYNNVMEALQAKGYSAQEALIVYLSSHRENYPAWETSPYNDVDGFAIIRNGAELKGSITLLQPHRCYLMLRPIIEHTIAELYVKPTLGLPYYTALSARIMAGTLRPEEGALLKKLRAAITRLTMLHAAGEFSVQFDGGGFTVVDAGIKDQVTEGKAGASDAQLIRFREEMDKVGNMLLQQLGDEMNAAASAEIYPEFFASSSYKAPETVVGWKEQNKTYKGIFRA